MTGEVKGEDLWHRSMPLAVWQVAIKLCLDLGEGGEEALQLDSTADRFSDNAHTTIGPRSVDTRTLL